MLTRLTGLLPFGREAAFYPAREAGAAVFGLKGWPVGHSLWGKPGWVGFEPARGEAPIEAGVVVKGFGWWFGGG